jgi:hypothetical protein
VRLTATSPTFGPVTLVIGKEPSQECYDLLCQATPLTAPCLIRAWKRRSWIAHDFRTWTHLLATDACQVHGEDAYYGHLVWRLLAALVLLYTARRLLKGRVTREELVFSLTHHWRFLHSKDLELHERSWDLSLAAACMLAAIIKRKSQNIPDHRGGALSLVQWAATGRSRHSVVNLLGV